MSSRRHTPESIMGTTILLVCGVAMFTLSRVWGIGPSRASQMVACVGPVAIVLGIGMAIHGNAMPINRITLRTRLWGIVGSAVSVLNLWMVGYFDPANPGRQFARIALPLVLLIAWLLPARFYGDGAPPSPEPTPKPRSNVMSARPQARAD